MKKKKARGYDDELVDRNNMFQGVDLIDFFKSLDPYEFLTKFNKVSLFQTSKIIASLTLLSCASLVQHRQRISSLHEGECEGYEDAYRPAGDV